MDIPPGTAEPTPPIANFGPSAVPPAEETALLAAARGGDNDAFLQLLERYRSALRRLAEIYAADVDEIKDALLQDRSSLLSRPGDLSDGVVPKVWITRVFLHRFRVRWRRERRMVPLSALRCARPEMQADIWEEDHFVSLAEPRAGSWRHSPRHWEFPETGWSSSQEQSLVRQAVLKLSLPQREVLVLRDLEGWSAEEVCGVLGLNMAGQRELLHRARTRLYWLLDEYFASR